MCESLYRKTFDIHVDSVSWRAKWNFIYISGSAGSGPGYAYPSDRSYERYVIWCVEVLFTLCVYSLRKAVVTKSKMQKNVHGLSKNQARYLLNIQISTRLEHLKGHKTLGTNVIYKAEEKIHRDRTTDRQRVKTCSRETRRGGYMDGCFSGQFDAIFLRPFRRHAGGLAVPRYPPSQVAEVHPENIILRCDVATVISLIRLRLSVTPALHTRVYFHRLQCIIAFA